MASHPKVDVVIGRETLLWHDHRKTARASSLLETTGKKETTDTHTKKGGKRKKSKSERLSLALLLRLRIPRLDYSRLSLIVSFIVLFYYFYHFYYSCDSLLPLFPLYVLFVLRVSLTSLFWPRLYTLLALPSENGVVRISLFPVHCFRTSRPGLVRQQLTLW